MINAFRILITFTAIVIVSINDSYSNASKPVLRFPEKNAIPDAPPPNGKMISHIPCRIENLSYLPYGRVMAECRYSIGNTKYFYTDRVDPSFNSRVANLLNAAVAGGEMVWITYNPLRNRDNICPSRAKCGYIESVNLGDKFIKYIGD